MSIGYISAGIADKQPDPNRIMVNHCRNSSNRGNITLQA
ncbi:hypothetical protein SCG7086_DH_00010, partial [Chlamydiales bacterium SCGC AG-110-P3]